MRLWDIIVEIEFINLWIKYFVGFKSVRFIMLKILMEFDCVVDWFNWVVEFGKNVCGGIIFGFFLSLIYLFLVFLKFGVLCLVWLIYYFWDMVV